MNAQQLLMQYERIADAPDAVERLRRFVLDLAVRGKLVPQDSSDEPASKLLKRITSEKLRLTKDGVISREKGLPLLSESDCSFPLPDGWTWVRLGNLSQMVTSGSRDWAKHYASHGAIFVRMGNLSKGHYRLRLDQIQRVNPPNDGEGTRTRLDAGDILISITGEVGMLGLVPEDFGEAYINQHTAMVRPMPEMKGRFLPELFRSPFAHGQFNEPQRGIKNSFRLTDVTQFVVPLPPLAEQHRIVAKVDELMALCDRLEAARLQREATRDRLAAASLARLNTPDPETFQADARFAIGTALPALTTRPDQIKQLRQTILNLAVCGNLVPQESSDGHLGTLPVQSTLDSSTAKGRRGVQQYGQRDVPSLLDPLPLPPKWTRTRLADVALSMRYGTSIKCEYASNGVPVVRIPNVSSGKMALEDMKFGPLSEKEAAELSLVKGDLLFIRSNGSLDIVGRAAVVTSDAEGMSFAGYLVRVRVRREHIDPTYVWLAINSSAVRDQIERPIRSAVGLKNINLTEFGNVTFSIPPLAEQHRIVAKVDELMALCDQLEASLTHGENARSRLLNALLHEALAPVPDVAAA